MYQQGGIAIAVAVGVLLASTCLSVVCSRRHDGHRLAGLQRMVRAASVIDLAVHRVRLILPAADDCRLRLLLPS